MLCQARTCDGQLVALQEGEDDAARFSDDEPEPEPEPLTEDLGPPPAPPARPPAEPRRHKEAKRVKDAAKWQKKEEKAAKKKAKKEATDDWEQFMPEMPNDLLPPEEIAKRGYLKGVSMFEGLAEDGKFICAVAKVLEDRKFKRRDMVIEKGTIGNEMYFVVKGEA